ncbi:hypothetical protein, partial [Salinispira pacifica]
MQEPERTKKEGWRALIESTRTLLLPFDAGITWLVAVATLLFPSWVDRLIGFGTIFSPAGYRIIGVIGIAAAAWQTWVIAARAFRPATAAVGSVAGAAAAAAISFGLAMYHSPLRPGFRVIFWVVAVFLLLQSVWLALAAWNMGDAAEEDAEEATGTQGLYSH